LITDDQPLLLDTHCWIWSQFGLDQEFSPAGLALFRKAASDSILRLSIISVWEVALLESKRRIHLEMDCGAWVNQALKTPGLSLIPLTPEIAVESTRLPGSIHGDPADRILVATARNIGARLMTRDRQLLKYKHARVVSA
jgi:PIN domain nuclease of toxin-antitoxin system